MGLESVLIFILVSLFLIFGLRSFINFLEDLITSLLKIAGVGIAIALFLSIGKLLL